MNARNAAQRGLRSFLQGFVATLLASPVTQPNAAPLARTLTAAILAGAYGLLSFAHNLLEDNTPLPKLAKPEAVKTGQPKSGPIPPPTSSPNQTAR